MRCQGTLCFSKCNGAILPNTLICCDLISMSFKILIKISNAIEYIESDIQNTEPPRTDDPIV